MPKVKYTDWRSWWEGMRPEMMMSGAKAAFTQISAFGASNTIAALPLDIVKDTGMNWKTMIVCIIGQFIMHSMSAAFKYMSEKAPEIIVENVETTFLPKPETEKQNDEKTDP